MNNWKNKIERARAFSSSLNEILTEERKKEEDPDFLIPTELSRGTRGNIEEVCRQINGSYYSGYFDAAAVLIRKVIEILLILSFKHHAIEQSIKDSDGNYIELSKIIREAIRNSVIDLSRNAKEYLEIFREKGNLSAHNPFHLATQKDLARLQPQVRHLFQELLFKSGIRS